MKQPINLPIQLETALPVLENASLALILECPTTPPDRPVKVLLKLIDPVIGYLGALELGAAYEFGLHVAIDPEASRRWYFRYILMNIDNTGAQWDNPRARIATFNPARRNLTEAAFSDALSAKKLAAPIFENEIARIQDLKNGRIEDLVAAIDDFANGARTNRHDVTLAGQALHHLAKSGHPEAIYALALGILEQRFEPWNRTISAIRAQAQYYFMKAAVKRYVPALLKLAELCEGSTISTAETAIAFYQIAAEEKAQIAKDNLRRLHTKYPDAEKQWINKAMQDIKAGHLPLCG